MNRAELNILKDQKSRPVGCDAHAARPFEKPTVYWVSGSLNRQYVPVKAFLWLPLAILSLFDSEHFHRSEGFVTVRETLHDLFFFPLCGFCADLTHRLRNLLHDICFRHFRWKPLCWVVLFLCWAFSSNNSYFSEGQRETRVAWWTRGEKSIKTFFRRRIFCFLFPPFTVEI